MAFGDFTYPEVFELLGLTERSARDLFATAAALPAPPDLQLALQRGQRLALSSGSEKARSEWLIAPVLLALSEAYLGDMSLFSGIEFNADADAGLNGYCDFIIGHGPQLFRVTSPVAIIIEAKKEDIVGGLGQCIAGMVGAQRFNAKHKNNIETVYGCVSSGTNRRFLQLQGTTIAIDQIEYPLAYLDKLLGIFSFMLGPVPKTAAA